MSNRIDLHLHTNISDGSDTVQELYNKIKNSKIHAFSVTDHDRMEGTLMMEQLIKEHKPDNLLFVRGIEFSCITPVKKCHILGYNFDPTNPEFIDTLNLGIRLRKEKTQKRIDYWKTERGIELTKEEADWLYSVKSIGRPHFGQIILNRGLAPDLKTAIKEYVSPCKVGNDRIDADAAIRAIRHAGGISIWAHPLGGEGEKRLTQEEFYQQLEILIQCGIQGLECYYSRYSQEDISFLLEEAKKHNLFISAGSDYHGDNKPNLPIGKLSENNIEIHENELSLYKHLF
jgi:predicted metal-dependent phosphoesterase TrpH